MEFDDFADEVLVHHTARLSEFEDMVIKGLLSVDSFCNVAINLIKPEYFEDNYNSLIFNKIKEFYNTSQNSKLKVPQKDILKTIFKKDSNFIKKIENDITYFFNKIDTLYDSVVIDDYWLTQESETWLKEKAIKNSVYSLVDKAQNTKNIDIDISNSIPELQEALTLTLSPPEIVKFSNFENISNVLFKLSLGLDLVKSSSNLMMEVVGQNFKRGDVNCLIGLSGSGKTVHLLSHLKWHVEMGYNVLYVSFEIDVDTLIERHTSDLYNIKFNDIRTQAEKNLDVFKEKLQEQHTMLHQNRKGEAYFVQFSANKYGVREVETYLKTIERTEGKKIDCVIFDYLGKMKPSYTKSRNVDNYENLTTVANEMESFAQENKLLVWTAMQLKPEASQNETITNADIAQSKQIIFPMSFVYAFKQIKNKDIHKCFTLKTRKGKMTNLFVLGINFEYQRIFDIDQSELDIDSDDIDILKECITPDVPRDYNPYKHNEQKKQKPKFSLNL